MNIIKRTFAFIGRTFRQIVLVIAALQKRYKGMVISYRSQTRAGLMSGIIKIQYP